MSTPTVLHVDDEDGIRNLSRRVFERQAGDVTLLTASSAEAGLQALADREVDCLVSDSLTLSDGTPFVVAARERDPDLDIVLFTASEWEDIEPQALEAAVDEYIHKGEQERIDVVVDSVAGLLAPTAVEEAVEGVPFDDRDWEFVDRHEWDGSVDLAASIVEAIGSYADVDVDALPPLYESVDTEVLETLLAPRESHAGGDVEVRFDYEAFELGVTNDGLILVRGRGDYDPAT